MHCEEEKAGEIEYLAFFLNIHPLSHLTILLPILPFRSCKTHGLLLDFQFMILHM